MTPSLPPPVDPRGSALAVLDRVERRRRTLDDILDRVRAETAPIDRRDHALRHALIYGVLRWRARLDWVLSRSASRPLEKVDPTVRNILRLGLFQMFCMNRIPVSAAVDTSVELTRRATRNRATGFVNAVLRQAGRRGLDLPWPDPVKDPVGWISTRFSLPTWLARRWLNRFGGAGCRRLAGSVNRPPPCTLRVNSLRITRRRLLADLAGRAYSPEPTPVSPDGIRLDRLPVSPAQMAPFASGAFRVQDEAAQLVAHMVAPRPGERVLDCCAGLGGKTGHLAQLMENRGRILAADVNGAKLGRLEAEMKRLAVTGVDTVQLDLDAPVLPENTGSFDRILLDAPCSGLGVIRRNPDAKWSRRPRELQGLANRQVRFLDRLAPWVRPGGTLTYAVCSFEPEENEAVIARFLQSQPRFAVERPDRGPLATHAGLLDSAGFLRSFPHLHDMDGFFAARLRRDA